MTHGMWRKLKAKRSENLLAPLSPTKSEGLLPLHGTAIQIPVSPATVSCPRTSVCYVLVWLYTCRNSNLRPPAGDLSGRTSHYACT